MAKARKKGAATAIKTEARSTAPIGELRQGAIVDIGGRRARIAWQWHPVTMIRWSLYLDEDPPPETRWWERERWSELDKVEATRPVVLVSDPGAEAVGGKAIDADPLAGSTHGDLFGGPNKAEPGKH